MDKTGVIWKFLYETHPRALEEFHIKLHPDTIAELKMRSANGYGWSVSINHEYDAFHGHIVVPDKSVQKETILLVPRR